MPKMVLRYVGDGAWIRGVPARDLDEDDIKALRGSGIGPATLVERGLYAEVGGDKKADDSKPDTPAPKKE